MRDNVVPVADHQERPELSRKKFIWGLLLFIPALAWLFAACNGGGGGGDGGKKEHP